MDKYVDLFSIQSINGIKKFRQFPYGPATDPEEDYQLVNKQWVENQLAESVVKHNKLQEIQGGLTDEYYHLKQTAYAYLNSQDQYVTVGASPTFNEVTATSLTIGLNTLNTTEWGYLDGQDQSVFTTSDVDFTKVTVVDTLSLKNDSAILANPFLDSGASGISGSMYALTGNPEITGTTWAANDIVGSLTFAPSFFNGTIGNSGLDVITASIGGPFILGAGVSATLQDICAVRVTPFLTVQGSITADSAIGIDILDAGVVFGGSATVTTQTQLSIAKPTKGTTNYQGVLLGTGAGSGLWVGGTTGERIYSSAANNLDLATNILNVRPDADTDFIFNFIGTTNSGQFKWMEDEDYFEFIDDTVFDQDLFFKGDGSGLPYGSMYNYDISTVVTIGVIGTAVRVPSGYTQGQVNLATFQNSREIAVTKAGRYKIDWSISFTTASANQEIEGSVMINNVFNVQGSAHRRIATGTDTGAMGGTCVLDLAAGDVVALGVLNETSTANVIVEHSNLSLLMAGGT